MNIVFNVLATIKFNEPLEDAVEINILNTQKVIQIISEMKNLKSFMHVSTLFSNCNRIDADERISDHPMNYHQLIDIANLRKKLKDAKSVTLNFEHDFPNTYTLTKHFAEKMVVDQAHRLPTGIFRPPIVVSSYKNVPGWVDNLNGITGFIIAFSKNLSHAWYGCKENRSNTAPVDYCVNALIAAAWEVAEKFEESYEDKTEFIVPIYNFTSIENNITYEKIMQYIPLGLDGPSYLYFVIGTSSKSIFLALHVLFTVIPAIFFDLFSRLQGKKEKFVRMSHKIKEASEVTSPFTLTKYQFSNSNTTMLTEKVKKIKDLPATFDFDLTNIDWKDYYAKFLPGIRKYYFKEDSRKVANSTK